MSEYVLELRDITKIYGEDPVPANDRISLRVKKGEILCLAGENGAGKSTLMKILYGLLAPTAGEIWVRGQRVRIDSPKTAGALGIGMAHQHFMLFPEFTVAQNVVLGAEPVTFGVFFNFKRANQEVRELIRAHDFSLDPEEPVQSLSVGRRQQVEILKMLYRRTEIFILDEPTSVLTEQETRALFRTLRNLAEGGKTLVLITHKLREIRQIATRVAVLRQGKIAGIREGRDTPESEIFRLMIGKESPDLELRPSRAKTRPGGPVLIFQNVSVKHRSQNRPLLDQVSFAARQGEILGFAGVGGNGLETLEGVLSGFLPIAEGKIFCGKEDISGLDTRGLRRRGLAYVPGDRMALGTAAEASLPENLILGRRKEFVRGGFLDIKSAARFSRKLFERYGIPGRGDSRIRTLSGGNIQKVILAREIDLFRDYIVFSEPTWGLDAGASRYVYNQMFDLREKGAALLLISSNLDEILAAADRILVFCRGKIAGEITEFPQNIKEIIGAYMLGL
ncbi:MAG: ABC transporter ATP-binding protein [Spirochaetaceae bacterium]|jgi:simple sugar transport system ATP-binding protein|nr:ABC transporter ATP-binding protein [Spirochaetaceae bacterium]